jgi:stress response protein SCP2
MSNQPEHHLVRGQRVRLDQLTTATTINVTVRAGAGAGPVDVSCVAASSEQRVVDDRYVVFFNQPVSPSGEISLSAQDDDSVTFTCHLARLPEWAQTVMITATVEGDGATMRDAGGIVAVVEVDESPVTTFTLDGAQLGDERSLVLLEIYARDGWRLNAVGQGFAGGMRALMESFGVEVVDEISSLDVPATEIPATEMPATEVVDAKAEVVDAKAEVVDAVAAPEATSGAATPPIAEAAPAQPLEAVPDETDVVDHPAPGGPAGSWSRTALDLTGGFGSQKTVCDGMGESLGPQEWALVAAAPGRIDAPELSVKNGTAMVTNHRLLLYGVGGFSKSPRRAVLILATFATVGVEASRLSSLPWMATLLDDQGVGTALYFTDEQVAAAVAEALSKACAAVRSGGALPRPPEGRPWRPGSMPAAPPA